jgi:hypothetical protein
MQHVCSVPSALYERAHWVGQALVLVSRRVDDILRQEGALGGGEIVLGLYRMRRKCCGQQSHQ